MPSQYGFCSNTARCQLAKQRERVFIPSDGKCPQCAQPLIPEDMRRRRVRVLPLLLLLALGGGAYFAYDWFGKERAPIGGDSRPTPTPFQDPQALTDNPPEMRVVDKPDTNPEEKGNKMVKAEVLWRIDQYPKLSEIAPDQKEKLYELVSRARAMGCVMIIPFAEGQDKLNQKETKLLLAAAKTDAIKRLTQDPTMLIFVLGYSDKVGDSAKKDKISLARANSVLGALRDDAGIPNLMYAVGMGGTDMFSDAAAVRNRRVEVWVVFPQ